MGFSVGFQRWREARKRFFLKKEAKTFIDGAALG
jgi:hypothetical protein